MITFETPEDLPQVQMDVVDEPDLIITVSGKAIDKLDNIEIYFKREEKHEV